MGSQQTGIFARMALLLALLLDFSIGLLSTFG
jgi:hypothetical protein